MNMEGGGPGGLPPDAFCNFQAVRKSIFKPFIFQNVDILYLRGAGGLPPEAKAFWKF